MLEARQVTSAFKQAIELLAERLLSTSFPQRHAREVCRGECHRFLHLGAIVVCYCMLCMCV